MVNGLPRAALWALVVLVLAGSLASMPGVRAAGPTYTLMGYVDQAGGGSPPPVPAGVTVNLISSATHQVYSTSTASLSGQYSFTGANTAGALSPGWWGVWVPPQAHARLYGCNPCAVLPQNPNPQYYWESSSALTNPTANPVTVTGVALAPYNATIWGNVTYNGHAAGGALVQLLDPTINGFLYANNTTVAKATNTTVVGEYSLSVPYGTWVLETIVPGNPNHYSMLQVTVNSPTLTVNPAVANYMVWGWVNQASNPTAHIPAGGNVTVIDTSNNYVYSSPTPSGGYYSFGAYPAGFTGTGARTFEVVLAPVGWQTVSYPITISAASPNGSGPNPHIVLSSAEAPPAQYLTTLNFSSGLGKVAVSTHATLGNDSVFPELTNASVGQLWAQLALDWQHNLAFDAANLSHVLGWINASGPFFAAGQTDLTVAAAGGAVGFGQPTNYTFTNSTGCTGTCGLTSSAGLDLNWAQSYNVTGALAANAKNYTLAFTFRHPTNGQVFNYTIVLPSGYVLAAGNAVPAQSRLAPAGPGNTWTSFTLVSLPSASASSSATFSIVRYANVTAIVNVTTSNFAFSKANVLNQTRGNYQVIVGSGQNATFSALNSTFPAGTNGTLYAWAWGDGTFTNTSSPTSYHTYTGAQSYSGSLTVTSSGGRTSSTSFKVYTDNVPPTAQISTNATVRTAGSVSYVWVNWSRTLHFNASTSTDTVYSGAPVSGVLSIASWNITSAGSYQVTANYTASSGIVNPSQRNLTLTFLGAGDYYTNGTLPFPFAPTFYGWEYNVSLKVWDGAGHLSSASLVVLVNDTEKPTPVLAIQDSSGRTISSSGIVEGPNGTARVVLSATNSTDPHNGSITSYFWNITNAANGSANRTISQPAVQPGFKLPSKPVLWLAPQSKPYTVNLTVTDRAGNTAYTTSQLTVSINTSQRPVLSVSNLTSPTTLTEGTGYTVWVNVTNTIGKNSTAEALAVRFYLLSPGGGGSQITIGGAVSYYNYSSTGVVSTTPWAGTVDLPYNHTVRAQISFTPGRTGTWDLWANATCANEFVGDYTAGANQAHVQVTLNPSPTSQYIIYGAVGGAAIVLIVVAVYFTRRRSSGGSTAAKPKSSGGSTSKPSLERTPKKDEEDDED